MLDVRGGAEEAAWLGHVRCEEGEMEKVRWL